MIKMTYLKKSNIMKKEDMKIIPIGDIVELKCENCGNKWEYKGENKYYTDCPKCESKIKIQEEESDDNLKRDISDIIKEYPSKPSSLIPVLQESQEKFGYLPRDVMEMIGEYLGLPLSKVYGVATFYAQFRFEPLGDHVIKACHGTACHVKGAEKITETIENELDIKTGETTEDGAFTLERVACLGCCSLAPVIMVDDTAHGNLTRDKVKDVLKHYREN